VGQLERLIKANGIAVSEKLSGSEAYFDLTPAGRTLVNTLDSLFGKVLKGRVLDAGAGRLTYRERLERAAPQIITFDRFRVQAGLDSIGDLHCLPFAAESFDSIFCSQVLEHVAHPDRVISEMARVLNTDGILLLSVPHLAYLHNEPYDYFRYTEFGLRVLLEDAGLTVEEVRWSGGLLSFLGHIPSTLLVNCCWGIKMIRPLILGANWMWSRTIAWLERNDHRPRRYALNLVVVARKKV
jgi:SAM-dependent methyltransferase